MHRGEKYSILSSNSVLWPRVVCVPHTSHKEVYYAAVYYAQQMSINSTCDYDYKKKELWYRDPMNYSKRPCD